MTVRGEYVLFELQTFVVSAGEYVLFEMHA